MSKFELFRGINSQFYFRFKARNGEQILSSEGYLAKHSCLAGIASVKRLAPYDSSYVRIDNLGNYRFNMKAENGEIVAHSSEGYTTRQSRDHAIEVVKREAPFAEVVDLTVSKVYGS